MAIYHLEAKVISRGTGRCVVAAAAYMSCTKLYNEYDGIQHDYTRKHGLVHQEIFCRHRLSRNGQTGRNYGTPLKKQKRPRTAGLHANLLRHSL